MNNIIEEVKKNRWYNKKVIYNVLLKKYEYNGEINDVNIVKKKGYFYIRINKWWIQENVVKCGISQDPINRSSPYITGEFERGEYTYIVEILLNEMKILDKCFKEYFKEYNVYKGGGTEFYKNDIIDLIEPYLQKTNIIHKILSKEEINELNRINEYYERFKNLYKIKNIFNNGRKNKIIKTNIIKPHEHQQNILDLIKEFFDSYNIGKIIWACGLGKALLSILIVKLLNFKLIAFCVPSNNLKKQILKEILKIFPNTNNILFVGGNEKNINLTNDKDKIINFINKFNNETRFVISTYHSCHLLVNDNIKFDLKIGDEAHHLVGIEKENKGFRSFHKIYSGKSLFMTATEKICESNKVVYSMDDENIFGKCIDTKSVYWAIENKKITDYDAIFIKNKECDINEILENIGININNITNIRLFISCYMCLKSFEIQSKLTHILLYTNTIEDANLSNEYINEILSLNIFPLLKKNIYNKSLHSKCNNLDLDNEINTFKNTPYGIISCIQIFGEGFDLPKLNGVCITGNMQSEVKIVQYLLRPHRLDPLNPNKKASIIIPYFDDNNLEIQNKSFQNIKNIISQLRNIDENIEQKISIYTIEKAQHKKDKQIKKIDNINFIKNVDELNKIKLRLRHSKVLESKCSEEQDEYNYVRELNKELNIQSKKEYTDKVIKDKHQNYIENPEEHFRKNGVWENWYDFLGIDTKKFIQNKQEWINFCEENNIKSLDNYNILYTKCDVLPKEPADFYINFTNIPSELKFTSGRR